MHNFVSEQIRGQLSQDLRAKFPDMPGFSERSLKYCLQFNAPSIGQQPVAQIPRGDNNLIFRKPRVKKNWSYQRAN
jgi:hypothetical protein